MQRGTRAPSAQKFGKYSQDFLAQIHNDLEELLKLVENKRDRSVFERVIRILRKELEDEPT